MPKLLCWTSFGVFSLARHDGTGLLVRGLRKKWGNFGTQGTNISDQDGFIVCPESPWHYSGLGPWLNPEKWP